MSNSTRSQTRDSPAIAATFSFEDPLVDRQAHENTSTGPLDLVSVSTNLTTGVLQTEGAGTPDLAAAHALVYLQEFRGQTWMSTKKVAPFRPDMGQRE